MRIDEYYDLVRAMPSATEGFPFGEEVAVFKVGEKMFATLNVGEPQFRTNLKCDPVWAMALREEYAGVTPGYHMNKKYWNTVVLDSDVPGLVIKEMLQHSYDLVQRSLTRKVRAGLGIQ